MVITTESLFIQQTSGLIAWGAPFEVLQQNAEGLVGMSADEYAYCIASGILHRREHLNAEVHVAELPSATTRRRGSGISFRSEM